MEGEDEDELTEYLNIKYVNINGLNDDKILNSDLMNDMENADIICFCETHLKDIDNFPIIKNYEGHHSIGKKECKLGRNIKGISIFFKDSLINLKFENIVNYKGTVMIEKISSTKFRCFKDIYLIICYRGNKESRYKDKQFFQIIKNYILQYNMENIILIGDLNGRIGLENDNLHFGFPKRVSADTTLNNYGRDILTFCNETKLIIANGRFEIEESKGMCTFHCVQDITVKKSMIDYFILSESILTLLDKFKISHPVLYTDHSPIEITLKLTTNNVQKENKEPKQIPFQHCKIFPYKWTHGNNVSFDDTIFQRNCEALSNKIDAQLMNCNDIYTELLQIKDESTIPVNRIKKSKYSGKITKLRNLHRKNVTIFKQNQSDNNLKNLLVSKRQLKTEIRKEKRKIKSDNIDKLIIAKETNDQKSYWKLINKNKKPVITSNLSAQDFLNQILNVDRYHSYKMTTDNQIEIKEINCDEHLDTMITKNEIKQTIKLMKSGKSSGPDKLVYEMFKINDNSIHILQNLFNKIMTENDEIPFSTSWITPIYKSGNKNDATSYRYINLSSSVEKILTKILNERLNELLYHHKIIHECQIGFRKGNSTVDGIFIVKEISQIYKNYKQPLYLCFIDLSKAFDSVPKTLVIKTLQSVLPNSNFLRLMTKLIIDKKYRILYNGNETDLFTLQNGVPQGDSLSPTLFSLFMNSLINEIHSKINEINAANIGHIKIPCLIYADDIVLMSNDKTGLIDQIKIAHFFCRKNGLKINYEKTKVMIQNDKYDHDYLDIDFNVEKRRIEIVKEYKYLGLWLSHNTKKHLEYLCKKGNKFAYLTAKKLREFGHVNGLVVKNTFDMLTLSKMKYGGEFCFHNKLSDLNKIQAQFYKRFYHLNNTTANYCLNGEFGLLPFEYHFYKAAINYWIKIVFCDGNNIIKMCYNHIKENLVEMKYSYTWCWRIQKLLKQLNLLYLWQNQKHLQISERKCKSIVKTRLIEHFRNEWLDSAKKSQTGMDYLELTQFDCQLKNYLTFNFNQKDVITLLKFRCGNHDLMVRIGSYKNRFAYEDRICNLCAEQKVETIFHFICECTLYNDIRTRFIPFCIDASKYDWPMTSEQ